MINKLAIHLQAATLSPPEPGDGSCGSAIGVHAHQPKAMGHAMFAHRGVIKKSHDSGSG